MVGAPMRSVRSIVNFSPGIPSPRFIYQRCAILQHDPNRPEDFLKSLFGHSCALCSAAAWTGRSEKEC